MEHFMTSEEIAEILHVDPVTIRRLVNKSELSAYRIGADYRFAPSDLQNYLQRQRLTAKDDEASANLGSLIDQIAQLFRNGVQGKHTTAELQTSRNGISLTKRARNVLNSAQEEARNFRHNYIGTEHLLLGLIDEKEGVAAQVFSNLKIEADQIRTSVEHIIGHGDRIVSGFIIATPRTKKVMQLAISEARHLNQYAIETEHILLGLIREGNGIGASTLKGLGLQLEQVRTETLRVLSQQKEQEEIAAIPAVPAEASTLLAEGESGLTCTTCEAHAPTYFRYCFNCGQYLNQPEK